MKNLQFKCLLNGSIINKQSNIKKVRNRHPRNQKKGKNDLFESVKTQNILKTKYVKKNPFMPDTSNLSINNTSSTCEKKNFKDIFLDKEILFKKLNKFSNSHQKMINSLDLKNIGSSSNKKTIVLFKKVKQDDNNNNYIDNLNSTQKQKIITPIYSNTFSGTHGNLLNYQRPKSHISTSSDSPTLISKLFHSENNNSQEPANIQINREKKVMKELDLNNSDPEADLLLHMNNTFQSTEKSNTKTNLHFYHSYSNEIAKFPTKFGCHFESKSQEKRFDKLYKCLIQIRRNIISKFGTPENLLYSFVQLFVPVKNQIDITIDDINGLYSLLLKMKNASQLLQNKIIIQCIYYTGLDQNNENYKTEENQTKVAKSNNKQILKRNMLMSKTSYLNYPKLSDRHKHIYLLFKNCLKKRNFHKCKKFILHIDNNSKKTRFGNNTLERIMYIRKCFEDGFYFS